MTIKMSAPNVYAMTADTERVAMAAAKTVGGIRQVIVHGLKRVDHQFVLTMTAYNLTRMRSLGQICPQAL